MSRDIQLGVVAASLAMRDTALTAGAVDPDRLGVSFGAGRISTTPEELVDAAAACTDESNAFDFARWGQAAMGEICPLWLLRQLPNMPACHVSIEFDARGPNNTITCRESSALLALAEAVGVIRRGAADCMIVGASSSNIHPVDIAKLSLFDGLSRAEDPEGACRPFDFDRDGTIVGEGGAAFVVERYNHAVRRGAKIYAEVLGVAAGCDGTGFSNGAGGTGLVRAVQSAMRQAGMRPSELGHINAHGKSTQRDDLVEARALHRAFDSDVETIPGNRSQKLFRSLRCRLGRGRACRQPLGPRAWHHPDDLELRNARSALPASGRPTRAPAIAAEVGSHRQPDRHGAERCRCPPRCLKKTRIPGRIDFGEKPSDDWPRAMCDNGRDPRQRRLFCFRRSA